MEMEMHWLELVGYLVLLGITWGSFKQTQKTHEFRIRELEMKQETIHEQIKQMQISAANAPTKEDFQKLTNDIQSMKISISRVEFILESHFKMDIK